MFAISKIPSPDCLQNVILRDRAVHGHCGRSQEFIALVDGEEVGLLSYEDWSERASAFVYEIFVLPPYRMKGLGSALLAYAEKIAVQLNCDHIRLKPHALAEEPDQNRLKAWYASHGYIEISEDPEHMEKPLRRQGSA